MIAAQIFADLVTANGAHHLTEKSRLERAAHFGALARLAFEAAEAFEAVLEDRDPSRVSLRPKIASEEAPALDTSGDVLITADDVRDAAELVQPAAEPPPSFPVQPERRGRTRGDRP